MGRRTEKRQYEEWPAFASHHRDGPAIVGGKWARLETSNTSTGSTISKVEYSTTRLRVRGSLGRGPTSDGRFTLRLSRTRVEDGHGRMVLARTFRCSVLPQWGGTVAYTIGVGQCSTWEEAVENAGSLDVAAAMRAHGKSVYDPARWKLVRPFKVVYPWSDPEEPNAQYSPFRLIGNWQLNDEDRGCVAMQYSPTLDTMRELATHAGANALLVADGDDELWVYHRGNMSRRDPITIEDFTARVIAGID